MQRRLMIILAFGYLAAGALGWWAGRDVEVKGEIAEKAAALSTRKLRKEDALDGNVFSDWVNRRLQKNQEDLSRREQGVGILAEVRAELGDCDDPRAEFEKLSKELLLIPMSHARLPGEEEEYQKKVKELALRWGQWLDLDPKGAMKKEGLLISTPGLALHEVQEDIAKYFFERDGIVITLERLKERGLGDRFIYRKAGIEIGKGGRLEEAKALIKLSGEGGQNPVVVVNMAGNWDKARADELLAVTPAWGKSLVVSALMRGMSKGELVSWTRLLIGEGRVSHEVAKRIAGHILYQSKGSGMSLDERFEFADEIRGMVGMESVKEVNLQKSLMVSAGIETFMKSDADWAYAFRQGVVSADEVMGAARDFLGEDSEYQVGVRKELYQNLVGEDPVRAQEVTVSEEDRDFTLSRDPRQYFESIKGSDEVRGESLKKASGIYLDRFGRDYLTWVDQIQNVETRRVALKTVAEEGGKRFPTLAAEAGLLLMKGGSGE